MAQQASRTKTSNNCVLVAVVMVNFGNNGGPNYLNLENQANLGPSLT